MLLQFPPCPLEQALLRVLLDLLHLPPVFLLDPPQQYSIECKERPANDQIRSLNNTRDHGRDAPLPVLLRVDNDNSRDEAGQGVGRAREVDPVQLPDIVRPPTEGQPQEARGTDATGDGGDDEQGHVLDGPKHVAGGGGLLSQLRVVGQVAEAGESSREDDEAGEQDPAEEGGEDVVQARDLVEAEEHLHVAGLEGVLPLQAGCGPSLRAISRG